MQNNKPGIEAFPARRRFIAQSIKAVAATALVQIANLDLSAAPVESKSYTVQEIINLILAEIPGAPFPNTVDTLKSGSPDQQVTGIVSCMFATSQGDRRKRQDRRKFYHCA